MAEKPEECQCCNFETTELKAYGAHRNFPKIPDEKKWLCELCAGTETGTYHEYPEQIDASALKVMKTSCYVGNAILAEIRDPRQSLGKEKT